MPIYEADVKSFTNLDQEGFTIVDFYSEACNPCKVLSMTLDEINKDIPFVNIIKTNTTKYPELGEKFGVMAVPTIVFMKDGKEVDRHVGLMQEDDIKEKISLYYY